MAYPLLVGFSSMPKVAVAPIFVLWFGSGTAPAILTAIVVNIATGLATPEPDLEDVLKTLGASKSEIPSNVGLSRTMPYFFALLKVAIALSFVGAVLSETGASNRGIRQSVDDGIVKLPGVAGVCRADRSRPDGHRALHVLFDA